MHVSSATSNTAATGSGVLTLYFLLFAAGLAFLLYAVNRHPVDIEQRLERLGQRVGEVSMKALWNVMSLGSSTRQAKAGSYYSDLEARRHEQLPVLSSSVLEDERVLFLHEMELGSRMNFLAVDGSAVRVTRKHAKRIEELLLFHEAYGDNMVKVFMQHGYVLEVA